MIGIEELPLQALLKDVGIDFVADKKPDDGKPFYAWGLSIAPGDDGAYAKVIAVEKHGPAWKAGITAGDTLIAVNGNRLSAKNFTARSQQFGGGALTVDYFRRDAKTSAVLMPKRQDGAAMKLQFNETPSSAQLALRKAWLGN